MDSIIRDLYDQAFLPFYSQGVSLELRDRVEREAKGFLQLVDEIKNKFFPDRLWSDMSVAELGAGMGGLSLLLARRGAKVTVVDCSQNSLNINQGLADLSSLEIEQVCLDLTHPDANLGKKFDLIIDSHLLHCITMPAERASYLSFVRDHLKGYFVGETMVYRKKIFIPPSHKFDDDLVLWQKFSDWLPVRKITDSLLLEEEFKNAHFYINYFFYYANFSFAPSE